MNGRRLLVIARVEEVAHFAGRKEKPEDIKLVPEKEQQ